MFQLKAGPDPFSRAASLRAVALRPDGSIGPVQTLTRERDVDPIALSLAGRRTLALWATPDGFDAALVGRDGQFAPTAAPAGPPVPGGGVMPNRDADAAGRYAIVAWTLSGTTRVSLRRF